MTVLLWAFQERLSHWLDLVEVELVRQISARSTRLVLHVSLVSSRDSCGDVFNPLSFSSVLNLSPTKMQFLSSTVPFAISSR